MDITVYIDQFMSYCKTYNISKDKQTHLFLANICHGLYARLREIFEPAPQGEQAFSEI